MRLVVASRPSPSATGAGDGVFRLTFVEPATLPVDTTVELDVDAEERANVVLIPAESVIREGVGPAVFVAVGDRAERRPVTTGLVDDERVEIVSGLKAGELLIVQGQGGLADGTRISVGLTSTAQP
ncbi:MAG: hypothetical protein FJW14_04955 [Acidimicrobiia bacterium]|nr:hypothetical protein [Acidimicrobiia bacterium]